MLARKKLRWLKQEGYETYKKSSDFFLILLYIKSTCFYPSFCFKLVFSSPQCLLTFFIIINIYFRVCYKKKRGIGWIFYFLSSLKTYSKKQCKGSITMKRRYLKDRGYQRERNKQVGVLMKNAKIYPESLGF